VDGRTAQAEIDEIVGIDASSAAVFGLTRAAFSQVTLVTGSGNSCSQTLLAKRPSQIR